MGQVLNYTDSASGRPIVMLHGNLASCRWWEKLVPRLPSGWRAICPDFRGYGGSPAAPPGYNATAMARDIQSLLETLEIDRYVLLGHSMGGAVALHLALEMPGKCIGLAMLDPVPAGGLALGPEVIEMMQQMRGSRTMLRDVFRTLAPAAPQDTYFDELVDDALLSGPQAWREIPLSFTSFNRTADLGGLTCPVLCVTGRDDSLIPAADVANMCKRITCCEQVILESVGHCPQIEAPSQCAAKLREFLGKL